MFDLIFNKDDSFFSERKKNSINSGPEHIKKMKPNSDLQFIHIKESDNSMTTAK